MRRDNPAATPVPVRICTAPGIQALPDARPDRSDPGTSPPARDGRLLCGNGIANLCRRHNG